MFLVIFPRFTEAASISEKTLQQRAYRQSVFLICARMRHTPTTPPHPTHIPSSEWAMISLKACDVSGAILSDTRRGAPISRILRAECDDYHAALLPLPELRK